MKKTARRATLLLMSLGLITSCSFTLSAKSISKGIAVLDSFIDNLNNQPVDTDFVGNNAKLTLNVLEQYKEEKKYVTKSSFDLKVLYEKKEECSILSYDVAWGSEKKAWYITTSETGTIYSDEEGERDASTSDPFNSMNNINNYIYSYLNVSVGYMFRSYLNCVYKEGDDEKSSLLTGIKVDSTSQNSWSFEVWSDYREEEESTKGISDRDYKKFFASTGIEEVPAYSMRMKIDSNKITMFSADYSYVDEDDKEKVIQGSLEVKVSYAG